MMVCGLPAAGKGDMIQVNVGIDGMMCGMCESHVADAIRKQFPDAQKVSASAGKGEAVFLLKDALPLPMLRHELHSAIDPLGYRLLSVSTQEPQKRGLFHFGKK